jgi:hypothetical protein
LARTEPLVQGSRSQDFSIHERVSERASERASAAMFASTYSIYIVA